MRPCSPSLIFTPGNEAIYSCHIMLLILFFFKVPCPPDYRLWLQTLYALFGCKIIKIFAGPMWSYEPIMQAHVDRPISVNPMNPQRVS